MRNFRKVTVLLFWIISPMNILWFSACGITQQSRTEAAERAIEQNPEFKETDILCKQIPLPDGTKFVGKSRLWKRVGLVYSYHLDTSPQVLDKFFKDYFTKAGWEVVKPDSINQTVDFKNEKIEVSVTLKGFASETELTIYCGKLNTQKR